MIALSSIDNNIEILLDFMLGIQNQDGSFDTMYLQPHYNPDKGWMKFPLCAAYDTAWCLTVLLKTTSKKSEVLITTGAGFIINQAFEKKLWSYPILSKEYVHFYDADSTALCSFVLEQTYNRSVMNKTLIDEFIRDVDYDVFFVPNKPVKQLSLWGQMKLWMHNREVRKGLAYRNNLMQPTDQDFIVTCNTLFYVGQTEKNAIIWQALKEKVATEKINYLYYPTLFQGIYFYARLCEYGDKNDMLPEKNILNQYIDKLYFLLTEENENQSIYRVMLANILLFMEDEFINHEKLFEKCIENIKMNIFREPTPFYSCNIKTDTQPNGKPNTYFGSPAITCSLYIEFLNLYRKRFYGKYYGEE